MEVTSGVIWHSKPYSIFAGKSRPDDSLVHYLVIHDDYSVIEYETDILAAAIAWAKHFSEELEKVMKDEPTQTESVAQNVLPFSKPN